MVRISFSLSFASARDFCVRLRLSSASFILILALYTSIDVASPAFSFIMAVFSWPLYISTWVL